MTSQVKLPEPLFWYRPVCNGEMYEGPIHNNSVGGKMLRDEKPEEWFPLVTTEKMEEYVEQRVKESEKLCDEAIKKYGIAVDKYGDLAGKYLALSEKYDALRQSKDNDGRQ